jgi:hypothetical protein
MNKIKNSVFAVLAICSLSLTSCFHIFEEVTFRNNGTGVYKMTIDMSEVKGMLDMVKGMAPTGENADSTGAEMPAAPENPMGQLGQQMSDVTNSIKNIQGISNVVEINDTTAFKFGYSFDFSDVSALNRALKTLNKEKYDAKVDEVYKFSGKNFERLNVGDIGAEMKKAMGDAGGDAEESGMDMGAMSGFFKDMSYSQIYHFPDRIIKKNDNKLGVVSDDKHTLTVKILPFDEDQQKQKVSVATALKLK